MSADQNHDRLIAALRRWLALTDNCDVELIQTHISSVLLTSEVVYKIKRPVNLGFLDFSTLERRRFCCEEELRLNRRLAPHLYLGVTEIRGSLDHPQTGGPGPVIEYAVKMRRFQDGALLSQQPEMISAELADELAQRLADFHASAARARMEQAFGEPEQVLAAMQQNFDQIRTLGQPLDERFDFLERWTRDRFRVLLPALAARKHEGDIRECHGDLHLGNIALEQGHPLLFDGIEFNPDLRWIDTFSELAFLLMDMEERGVVEPGYRLLNRYLELTGDYTGLHLLRFYQLYRAMVRAKVAAIGLHQHPDEPQHDSLQREYENYLQIGVRYTQAVKPLLVITHGVTGAGKSTVSGELMKRIPAIRVRSDVERKRLAGLGANATTDSPVAAGIYARDYSEMTYARLRMLAVDILQSGFSVIVDATFLLCSQRVVFQMLARELGVALVILDCQLPREELVRRVAERRSRNDDVSEANVAVLRRQLSEVEPLSDAERRMSVRVDGDGARLEPLVRKLRRLTRR